MFASRVGTALWAGNVRRSFRSVLAAADLNPADWTPRGTTQKATVVAHGSEYDGEVLDIIRVLARPQTAAEAKALAVAEDRKERTI